MQIIRSPKKYTFFLIPSQTLPNIQGEELYKYNPHFSLGQYYKLWNKEDNYVSTQCIHVNAQMHEMKHSTKVTWDQVTPLQKSYVGDGNSHAYRRFHPTSAGRNLGLSWTFPDPAEGWIELCIYFQPP